MKMKELFFAFLLLSFCSYNFFAGGIKRGVRISFSVTDEQIAFADSHFDYVMTPFLGEDVRANFTHAELYLYRSIQGTWENFSHFDWNYINQNENMFCHDDSVNQNVDSRITTIWGSYLMEPGDLVEPTRQDALSHWINYYAVTASQQVHDFNYDGLFIDSASHLFKEEWIEEGGMPWNYSDSAWRLARYNSLKFIKSYFPDKTVIFNGLHSGNGADSSLAVTDGGMWEDFAFNAKTGEYKGLFTWAKAIECTQENHDSSALVLVVKKPGLIEDLQARIFSVGSYLLIENESTVLTLSDYAYDSLLQYYPEFEIDLGEPLGDFSYTPDTLFSREFERGVVWVNPSSVLSKSITIPDGYAKIVSEGGGFVDSLGNCNGELHYEIISRGTMALPPVSAIILKDTSFVGVSSGNNSPDEFILYQNYPNPFNPTTTIKYSIPANAGVEKHGRASLRIYNILGEEVATLVNERKAPGNYSVQFDASDLPSGVYFYTLRVGDFVATKKMILLK